jgi:uncharacterized ion transporter superfamily protein YfcC
VAKLPELLRKQPKTMNLGRVGAGVRRRQESNMSETTILVVLGIKLAIVVFGVLAIGAILWWFFR